MRERTLILGIGNRWRGDDGAGIAAVEALAKRRVIDADFRIGIDVASDLWDAWQERQRVIVIDALAPATRPPGSIVVVDVATNCLREDLVPVSSHGLGLGSVVELGRELGRLSQELFVIGIVGSVFARVEGLSPAVSAAVGRLALGARSVSDLIHRK